jgi:Flp pilus assembly protein TadD
MGHPAPLHGRRDEDRIPALSTRSGTGCCRLRRDLRCTRAKDAATDMGKPRKHRGTPTARATAARAAAPGLRADIRTHWRGMLAMAALAIVLYANTIPNDYAVDDRAFTTEHAYVQQGVAGIPKILATSYTYGFNRINKDYRPLSPVTFAIETTLAGDNPHLRHAVNVCLYAATAALLYLLLASLLRDGMTAFFAAALFVAHPIHTEVVANIKSRDSLLCFLCMLASILFLRAYRAFGRKRYLVAGLAAAFLAMLSKETGLVTFIVAPLAIFVLDRATRAQALRLCGQLTAVTCIYIAIRYAVVGAFAFSGDVNVLNNSLMAASTISDRYATAVLILGRYLTLLVAPVRLSYDYSYNEIPVTNWSNPYVVLSLCAYLALAGIACAGLGRRRVSALGIALYLIPLSVSANIFVLLGSTMAERFVYEASLGFCLVLGLGLARMPSLLPKLPDARRRQIGVAAAGVILVLYGARTIARNRDWRDNESIFRAATEAVPSSFRAHGALAYTLQLQAEQATDARLKTQLYEQAITGYTRSLAILPANAELWYRLGYCLYQVGRRDEAMESMLKSLAIEPGQAAVQNDVATMYIQRNEHDRAIPHLERAIAANPSLAEAHGNLGICYHAQRHYAQAIACYERALALKPGIDRVYRDNLAAIAQYRAPGKTPD